MNLIPSLTPDSSLTPSGVGAWKLKLPPGPAGSYRLAQLDDYNSLARHNFPWQPPLQMRLRAKASDLKMPGTWGFGFWNDPFSLSFGFGGGQRRLPALPNAAWFFYASAQNYLSLRDDLPAQGLLAATFRSPHWPAALLGLGLPALPFLALTPTARLLRKLASRLIHQDAARLPLDTSQWHSYGIHWHTDAVQFFVDDIVIFETPVAPHIPLGFVLWIDNQYAAFPPHGKLSYGTLAFDKSSRLDIRDLAISPTK